MENRTKYIGDTENVENRDKSYLRRLAAELTNLGASLEVEVGDIDAAEDMYREALSAAIEAHRVPATTISNQEMEPPIASSKREDILERSLGKIKSAKNKLASAGHCCQQQIDLNTLSPPRTMLFSNPIKIDTQSVSDNTDDNKLFDAISQAVIMFNIGVANCKTERWETAFEMFDSALKPAVEVLDDSREYPQANILNSMLLNNVGHIYRLRGHNGEAMIALTEALELGERALDLISGNQNQCLQICNGGRFEGNRNASAALFCVATVLFNKASLYYCEEELEIATVCLVDALEYASSTPALMLCIIVAMNFVGRSYYQNLKYEEALQVYLQALSNGSFECGKSHLLDIVYSNILLNVGYVCLRSQRYGLSAKAFALSEETLQLSLGHSHPLVARLQQLIRESSSTFMTLGGGGDVAPAA